MKSEDSTTWPTDSFIDRGEFLATSRLGWQWIVARGLLTLLLGIGSFFFPLSALFAFTLVFAAYAFIDGILEIVTGLSAGRDKSGRWWSFILRGVLGIVIGVLFILMPIVMTVSYALVSSVLLAVWAIVGGALEVIAAIRLRKQIKGEWLLATSGLLLILLGLAIPFFWVIDPAATLISFAWTIGVFLVVVGTTLTVLGIRLRKVRSGSTQTQHGEAQLPVT